MDRFWDKVISISLFFLIFGVFLHLGKTLAVAVEPQQADQVDAAVEKGIAYLLARQHPDGGIGSERVIPGRPLAECSEIGLYGKHPAVAGLTGLALIANGSTPEGGPHRESVERLLGFLLDTTPTDGAKRGIVGSEPQGTAGGPKKSGNLQPMYGQGFAIPFLAECLGSSERPDLRPKLELAVERLVRSQNTQGGWRYEAEVVDEADISVTATQLIALRTAKNAGLYVPNETIDQAVSYIKRCHNADGGFRYRLVLKESGFARSAAALVALQSAGIYEGEEIAAGFRYLEQFLPDRLRGREPEYFVYGRYYAAQAYWLAGPNTPIEAKRHYAAIVTEMLARQLPDGSWPSTISNETETAMALILLRLPKGLLPSMQK